MLPAVRMVAPAPLITPPVQTSAFVMVRSPAPVSAPLSSSRFGIVTASARLTVAPAIWNRPSPVSIVPLSSVNVPADQSTTPSAKTVKLPLLLPPPARISMP